MSILSPVFWQITWVTVSIMLFVIGAFFGAGKLLIRQFEARLDQRFDSMEKARAESSRHWTSEFNAVKATMTNNEGEWRRVEREILNLKADLPLHYVRREDYVRNQTVIEAKIDGLAIKLENVFLKGHHDG